MNQKTNNKSESKAVKDNIQQIGQSTVSQVDLDKAIAADFRNALLVVSILANLVVLIFWVILQVTTQHDYEIASLLFQR